MSGSERTEEIRFERKNLLIAMAAIALVGLAIGTVNALTSVADNAALGIENAPAEPWVTEMTSIFAVILLGPLIFYFTAAWRLPDRGWILWIAGHLAAALVFSVLHVAAMTVFRYLLFPLFVGYAYDMGPDIGGAFIYEFRKDLLNYAVIAASFTMFRLLMQQQRDLDAARADARETKTVTLKCGGRTMHFDASSFRHAKSAGNYVEVTAGEQEHFARATLASVEGLLRDAGADVARVHRSWLVNRSAIAKSEPSGNGDMVLTLDSGETIPCSRRYRDAIG